MNLKKIKLITFGLIGLMLLSSCSNGSGNSGSASSTQKTKIGIIQVVEHDALDSSRKGFIDALSENGYKDGENIEIDYQNAQGDNNTLDTIAKNFKSQNVDLILAIATPSAQSVYNVIKDKPILITSVTDPVSAGLVKSMDKPDTNVSGTSDITPIEKQLKLLKELVPSAKKVGVLYNTSEANSEVQLNIVNEVAPGLGLEINAKGVTNTNEISDAMDAIIDKVDAFYVPSDNTIVSAISLVAKKALEKDKPLIGAEVSEVEKGALATEGIDYYKLGHQTGLMAVDALKGKDVSEMSIQTLQDTELVINKNTAEKLKIEISDELKNRGKLIEGE